MKRLIVVVITLLIVVVAIIAIPLINRRIQLSWAINEIAAAGDPVSFADLCRNHAWDSTNAAWHLHRAQSAADALFDKLHPTFHSDQPWDWRKGLAEAEQPVIESAFADHADVFAAIEKALQCQHYFDIDDTAHSFDVFQQQLFDRVGVARTFHRVLNYRCRYLASIGQKNEAAGLAIDALELARLQEQNPTIMGYMVAAACRLNVLGTLAELVRDGNLDAQTLADLDGEVELDDAMDGFIHALKTERAFGIEMGRQVWVAEMLSGAMNRPYLDYMQAQIKLGPVSQFEESVVAAPQDPYAATVAPAIVSCRELMNRQRASIRCLRVLIALQQHPDKTVSANSLNVSDLGLIESQVADPFSGDPVIIRKVANVWMVYSVGPNGLDDGGVFQDDLDIGF